MPSFSLFPLAAVLLISLAKASLAKDKSTDSANVTCSHVDRGFRRALLHPNATGTHQFPAPAPIDNSTIPEGDWSVNTGITIDEDSTVMQHVWVDTPNLHGLKERDIPFSACAIAFWGMPKSTYINGQNDDGSCLSMLSQDCVSALTSLASPAFGGTHEECASIQQKIGDQTPEECKQFGDWGTSMGTTFLKSAAWDDESSQGARDTGCATNNNDTVHPLFGNGINMPNVNTTALNTTEYDEFIYRVVPFLLTTIANDSGTDLGEARYNTTSSEGISQLMCVRAKDIEDGSRAPAALSSPSATPTPSSPPKNAAVSGRDVGLGGVLGLTMTALMAIVLG